MQIRGYKNFFNFSNSPLDVCRICSRIAVLDGQAMFIPRCLAIGVFTRHSLFFNKLTVKPALNPAIAVVHGPNSSESAIAPASSFRKKTAWGEFVAPNLCVRGQSTLSMCVPNLSSIARKGDGG